jgi:hypothetical protein
MTSLQTDSHTRPSSRRRKPPRRAAKAAAAGVAVPIICAVAAILAPTPAVEKAAQWRAASFTHCAKLTGLTLHLHSWPVIARVLVDGSIGVSGHVNAVTTATYTAHDVSFNAHRVNTSNLELIGATGPVTFTRLTAQATLTDADLTFAVRRLTGLPIDIHSDSNGMLQVRTHIGPATIEAELNVQVSGSGIDVSAPLPILDHLHLTIKPPNGLRVTRLITNDGGVRLQAELPSKSSADALLCEPSTS